MPRKFNPKNVPIPNQITLFKLIWEVRPHRSEVNPKQEIPYFSVDCFAHILGKGAYPAARLDPTNIMLITRQEHDQWDDDRGTCYNDPAWSHIITRYERLKKKYTSTLG